jgi:hypothetical protein
LSLTYLVSLDFISLSSINPPCTVMGMRLGGDRSGDLLVASQRPALAVPLWCCPRFDWTDTPSSIIVVGRCRPRRALFIFCPYPPAATASAGRVIDGAKSKKPTETRIPAKASDHRLIQCVSHCSAARWCVAFGQFNKRESPSPHF